jgi:hypothetical protein
MKKFQVAPFDQHLTCEGRDLNDNQATLASLRIFPGTVIILQVSQTSPSRFFFFFFPFDLIEMDRLSCVPFSSFYFFSFLFRELCVTQPVEHNW